eukprot:NODE_7062_length_1613_cov_1.731494.p1 GENE.NODE_7062_length_1613_cov_1.731494~~NODE_7062_length_1613_cov_1.731494.p1  ORF type:complete len:469 (-),score=132.12 NODE_7062_length_1613_cov_1.731494:111-1517(-)
MQVSEPAAQASVRGPAAEAMGVASGLWDTLGAELTILLFTFAFATLFNRHARSIRHCSVKAPAAPSGSPQGIRPRALSSVSSISSSSSVPSPRPRSPSASLRTPDQILEEINEALREEACYQALDLYAELRALGEVAVDSPRRRRQQTPLAVYTALLQCAIRGSRFELVEGIFDDMVAKSVRRTPSFYEGAMKQLAGKRQFAIALRVYDRFAEEGYKPSAVTCSCLVDFAVQVGDVERSLAFFSQLKGMTTPSIRAYMTVLRLHARTQDWPAAFATLRDMQQRGVTIDCLSVNVVLATGVASDRLTAVEELLAEVEAGEHPALDVVSYNTVVKGYAQRGDVEGALQTMARMRRQGVHPNAITFNTAMDAAVRATNNVQAGPLLHAMEACGIRPDRFTCSVIVKGVARKPTVEHIRAASVLMGRIGSACGSSLQASLHGGLVEAAVQLGERELAREVSMPLTGRSAIAQ